MSGAENFPMKKQGLTPHKRKTPPGCTPFLLLRRTEDLPKKWLGIERLIAALYSPEEIAILGALAENNPDVLRPIARRPIGLAGSNRG